MRENPNFTVRNFRETVPIFSFTRGGKLTILTFAHLLAVLAVSEIGLFISVLYYIPSTYYIKKPTGTVPVLFN